MSDGVTPPALRHLTHCVAASTGWARELGFEALGVTDVDAGAHRDYLAQWLASVTTAPCCGWSAMKPCGATPQGFCPGPFGLSAFA